MLNLRFSSLSAAKVTIFWQKTACFESFNVISSTESFTPCLLPHVTLSHSPYTHFKFFTTGLS